MGVHRKENLFFKKYSLFIYQWGTGKKSPRPLPMMYIYSSLSFSISPPYSLVVFVILTKVKAVLA